MAAAARRVALVCGNSLDMPIAMFAIHAAGAQAVPINPAYTTRELSYILGDAEPAAIVYDAEVAATVEPLIASLGIKYAVRLGSDGRALDTWKDDVGQALPKPLPRPADLATLQYTGGTTGLPKGVNITHGADGGQHQPARGGATHARGRREHPVHDAVVSRVRCRDVPASGRLLSRPIGDHTAL